MHARISRISPHVRRCERQRRRPRRTPLPIVPSAALRASDWKTCAPIYLFPCFSHTLSRVAVFKLHNTSLGTDSELARPQLSPRRGCILLICVQLALRTLLQTRKTCAGALCGEKLRVHKQTNRTACVRKKKPHTTRLSCLISDFRAYSWRVFIGCRCFCTHLLDCSWRRHKRGGLENNNTSDTTQHST